MTLAERSTSAILILLSTAAALALAILQPLPAPFSVMLGVLLAAGLPALLLGLSLQREQQQRLTGKRLAQQLIDALPHPIFVRDAQSRLTLANQAYAQHLGKPLAEILGQTPAQLVADQGIAQLMQTEDQAALDGLVVSKETLSHHPLGAEPRHLVVSKASVRSDNGERMLVGSYFDVSRWRRAEIALQEAVDREVARRERVHDYVQRLIDVIPQPVYIKNAQSRYVLVNEAFCKERGRSKQELMGQFSYALTSDETLRQRILAEDAAVLGGQPVFKEEHLPHMYTGKERFRLISKDSCLDAEGNPVIVGANFDITQWRVAERELQEALGREVGLRTRTQDFIQRLIDVIPHPVYVKDARGLYELVNEAFARDRGWDKDALVGHHWLLDKRESAFSRQVSLEDREVLAGRIVLKEEHKAHPVTGKERFRVVAKGSCLNADGEPVIVCAVFDVTDWRLAEARWMRAKEAADRANEAKTLFLANMSHELRTPMHAILSFARLGETRAAEYSPDKLKAYFGRIAVSGERLLGLLNDLLDLAKLESGRAALNLRPFDIRIALQESMSEFRPLLDAKGLAVDLDCHEHTWVRGDALQIGQVLRNLLDNAIKFSPEQSKISVRLLPAPHDPAFLQLEVADQGVGIPEHELECIFDKFYQSSHTRTGAGGTGLGLAICREIVRVHGGEILARNRRPEGAELVLRLPVAEASSLPEIEG